MNPRTIPLGARPKLSFRARLQTDKVTGKPVLLFPEGALMLNPTGHSIVALCDGTKTFQEIVSSLAKRYNTSPEEISIQVSGYLDKLRARNLLEFPDAGEVTP